MPEIDETLEEARLGIDTEDFVKSNVGQAMLRIARQDAEDAKQRLATVHPWRSRAIRQYQTQVWQAQSFEEYLVTLVERGRQAVHQLQE